jgi:toxin ParE1/3/4
VSRFRISYPQGSHVIFYLVREDGIDVIGVPHQCMDMVGYFDG